MSREMCWRRRDGTTGAGVLDKWLVGGDGKARGRIVGAFRGMRRLRFAVRVSRMRSGHGEKIATDS